MSRFENVRGVLLDIDGTLLADAVAIPGAADAIARLRAARLPFRLFTNTSRRSRRAIADVLRAAGLSVDPDEILTPAALARRRIAGSGRTRALLLVPDEARADLDGVTAAAERPDWVVVGDLGDGFTHGRLSGAFRAIRDGAGFLALHKNRFWHDGARGWVLDAGAYVAALEYATGIEAELLGKPAPAFFRLALEDLGLQAGEVLMVGDDRRADIAGGRAAGCRTALVRTGRSEATRDGPGAEPDAVLDSIADLSLDEPA